MISSRGRRLFKPAPVDARGVLPAFLALTLIAQALVVTGVAADPQLFETWGQQSLPEDTRYTTMRAVAFGTSSKVYAVGDNGTILASSDGGSSWIKQNSTISTRLKLHGVSFVGEHGWAVGDEGTILTTTNGGAAWTEQTSPYQGRDMRLGIHDPTITGSSREVGVKLETKLTSVSFVPGGTCGRPACFGTIVGDKGAILSTSDAGKTWVPQAAPVTTNLNAVTFVTANVGWAVGDAGVIIATRDGGFTWTVQRSGGASVTNNFASVSFADAQNGWAVGGSGVFRTTDGGTNWISQNAKLPTGLGSLSNLSSVSASKAPGCPVSVPACIVRVGSRAAMIIATTDGESWTRHFACEQLSASCGAGSPDLIRNKQVQALAFSGSGCPPDLPACNGIAVGEPGPGASGRTLLLKSARYPVPQAPTIQGLEPAFGCEAPHGGDNGTWIRIKGTNLAGAAATFGTVTSTDYDSSSSPERLVVSVSDNLNVAQDALITLKVTNMSGSAVSSVPFRVAATRHVGPCLTVNRAAGLPGDRVTLVATGSNAASTWGTNPKVFFNGVAAQATPLSGGPANGRAFEATVPSAATTGPLTVEGDAGALSTVEDFEVLDPNHLPPPIITMFKPAEGIPGAKVTVTGAHFYDAVLDFNGTQVLAESHSPYTSLTAFVPVNATTGPLTVITAGGATTSKQDFTVLPAPPPEITSLSPPKAEAGAVIGIHGKNLQGGSVTFSDNVSAPRLGSGVASILTKVPDDAVTGPITVRTSKGEAVSPTPFVLLKRPGEAGPLSAEVVDPSRARLSWRLAGQDGNEGPPVERYEIRYGSFPIDASNFDAAGVTKLCDDGSCSFSFSGSGIGAQAQYLVSQLLPDHTYYFALRPRDADGLAGRVATAGPLRLPGGAGTWKPVAGLSPRSRHTATLMGDGRILVAGGIDADGKALASAEIYDPSTGAVAALDEMNFPRYDHSATVLRDGSLLVVGGFGSTAAGSSRTLEVYSFGEEEWFTVLPNQNAPREMIGHAALRLENNKVLITGGRRSNDNTRLSDVDILQVDSAKVFSGQTNAATWSKGTRMLAERGYHSMILLSGSGQQCGSNCGSILLAGWDQRAELYDPDLGASFFAGEMKVARESHTANVLPDGKVLIAAGASRATGNGTPSTEVFDPMRDPTSAWTFGPPLDSARERPAAARLPTGEVLVAGGSRVAESYDADAGKWYSTKPLNAPRPFGATATLVSSESTSFEADPNVCGSRCGNILVVGGSDQVAAELYVPPPRITAIAPAWGTEGTIVEIIGSGFPTDLSSLSPEAVLFGSVPAKSFSVDSYGHITAVAPALTTSSEVALTVITEGGAATSAERFVYEGVPGAISGLKAEALSGEQVQLNFGAAGLVADTNPPARSYIVKQSADPIASQEDFAAAESVCVGGACTLDPANVGDLLTVLVRDLTAERRYHYAVRAQGKNGTLGPISHSVSVTTLSVIPGQVDDLKATGESPNEISLSFSAPGSNGLHPPPVENFVIKQSRDAITDEASFEAARTLCGGLCNFSPVAVGDELVVSVIGLSPRTEYHFALRPVDTSGLLGPMSNRANAFTLGGAPGAVTDLTAEAKSSREVRLTFSAPGAAGNAAPPAGEYVVKQSREPLRTESDFESARSLCGGTCKFSPRRVGDPLSLTVTDLTPGITYHYALRAVAGPELGAWSNIARATTPREVGREGRGKDARPGRVRNLKASVLSPRLVKLRFSAPGTDGKRPPPARKYIIKQSRGPLSSKRAFSKALSLCSGGVCKFVPRRVGDRLSLTVTDLSPGSTYFYAIIAVDEGGRKGPRSNVARVKMK